MLRRTYKPCNIIVLYVFEMFANTLKLVHDRECTARGDRLPTLFTSSRLLSNPMTPTRLHMKAPTILIISIKMQLDPNFWTDFSKLSVETLYRAWHSQALLYTCICHLFETTPTMLSCNNQDALILHQIACNMGLQNIYSPIEIDAQPYYSLFHESYKNNQWYVNWYHDITLGKDKYSELVLDCPNCKGAY